MGVSVDHRTFVIERRLPGSPAHAFRFWSDFALKRRWTSCHPDWTVLEDRMDFTPGGEELSRWRLPDGVEWGLRAHYLEIHPAQRLVYAYTMSMGAATSSSLVTVELIPSGQATTMTWTEQGVFATAGIGEAREQGTGIGFARLIAELQRERLN